MSAAYLTTYTSGKSHTNAREQLAEEGTVYIQHGAGDTLSHGNSVIPSDSVTRQYYFDQLLELLDALGIRRGISCGYSTGTQIEPGFALEHPHRVSAIVPLMGWRSTLAKNTSSARDVWLMCSLVMMLTVYRQLLCGAGLALATRMHHLGADEIDNTVLGLFGSNKASRGLT